MNHQRTPTEKAPRPSTATWAVYLLYASLCIGAVRSGLEFDMLVAQAQGVGGKWFILYIQAFVFALMFLLFFMLGKGKNWARWVFTALFAVGLPFSIVPLLQAARQLPLSGLIGALQMLGQLIAAVLLFTRPSRDWFSANGRIKPEEGPGCPPAAV